ncbi:MAG TPA: 6-bladed beta-propeller [Puia sp.]|nr:6-bladed beta-propeller [Puia sp.]
MKRKIALFALIICVLIFAAYTIPTAKNRYRGYQKAIDIAHIRSVPGKQDARLLDIKIPLSNSTTFDYNKNLKDLHFVKLETSARSKIGSIDKILLTDSRIIIVDFNASKGVYIFDSSGRFINKILANKDPKDNTAVVSDFYDVAYDYTADEIILHDQTEYQSSYFDRDGHFRKASKEYVYFANLVNLKNTDKYVYINSFGGNDHIPVLTESALYFGKRNTEILYTATDAVKNMKTGINYQINNNSSFNNSNNKVFYTPEFSDTVYQIAAAPLNVYPKLVIHYPGADINSIIKKENKEGIDEYINLENQNKYYSFKGEIFSNDDSIYYIATYKDGLSGYFYSEKTNKIIGGDLVSTVLPKDSAQIKEYRYPITTFNDYFVSALPASDFGHTAKPTDNPVLAFYKLKNF